MSPERHPMESDEVKEADEIVRRYNEGSIDISFAQALEAERVIILRNIEFARDKIVEGLNRLLANTKNPEEKAMVENLLKETVERFNLNIATLKGK